MLSCFLSSQLSSNLFSLICFLSLPYSSHILIFFSLLSLPLQTYHSLCPLSSPPVSLFHLLLPILFSILSPHRLSCFTSLFLLSSFLFLFLSTSLSAPPPPPPTFLFPSLPCFASSTLPSLFPPLSSHPPLQPYLSTVTCCFADGFLC